MFIDGSKTVGGKAYRQSEALKDLVKCRDNFTCQLCGRRPPDVKIEIDHIIPHIISNDSTLANLRVLCLQCNRDRRELRNTRLPLNEYYAELEIEKAGISTGLI